MMRVIAGERKGLQLKGPGKNTKARPTENKIKEAIFNILQPLKKEARVLDLFAATGQMGIEFLSRGASFCVFSEKDYKLNSLLKENLMKAHYEDSSQILIGDFRKNIKDLDGRFDYIYVDPPFAYGYEIQALDLIRKEKRLKRDGIVIVESGIGDEAVNQVDHYQLIFKRDYKSQTIRMFKEMK